MMRSKLIGSKESIENFQFVTINGKVEFENVERISRIAYYYSKAVKAGINLALKGVSLNDAVKELYKIIPYAFYAETAYKQALALVENKGSKVEIRKKWIACRGSKGDNGNRGIKFHVFQDHVEVRVKDPWGKWVHGKAYFGRKYLPLLSELKELSRRKEEGYGAVISFKHYPMIHLQIPLWLYLKHFSSLKPNGYGLFAGFDLNSDRLNVVVINKDGEIIAKKTWWYSDVTRPGFPKGKARALRLNALSESLNFLSRIGVDYVAFEDLFLVKNRRFTRSKSGNRKVLRFAKRQMLTHGVIKALRLGFNVVLVNPKGTTNSEYHDKIMREKGFDRHTASAYLIALKGLEVIKNNE
ncbi:OrfB transposable element-related protein, IS605 [Acidianus hospitalis W1]|uniref:OrfB transposable element-related protein, IS605 n=2 Tax=Acidianus hospitalis TaxID=563177 RepID=F4B6U9_ACIHW|nr:OrfB transposable element-related protein, IS605 [Acidianus hospitalis W1]